MIQRELISVFKDCTICNSRIIASVLYGSFARNNPTVNSDIDLAILVDNEFNEDEFIIEIEHCFKHYKPIYISYIALRNKFVIYFMDLPKIEIAILTDIIELKRNYLGSNIPDNLLEDSILFDRTNHISNTISKWKETNTNIDFDKIIDELISKFVYEFESCSNMHCRSDGYQFYYFYNIAFHIAVQLKYISQGNRDYYFLPKKMTVDIISEKEEQQRFYDTSGSTYLREANGKKRLLLDLFYSSLEMMNIKRLESLKILLEQIYNRDFIWNFRDIAKFNINAKSNVIYRTSSFTSYQSDDFLLPFLKSKNITTIVDLRAEREIHDSSYDAKTLKNVDYVVAAFDPWNQPDWFKDTDHYGTNTEIAYRFFAKGCKDEVKIVFKAILSSKGAVAIHCLAGKDRTGFVIMLIGMLINISYEDMLNDYLASELDTDEYKFRIYYNNIENEGGINDYLLSCGLAKEDLFKLKKILRNE